MADADVYIGVAELRKIRLLIGLNTHHMNIRSEDNFCGCRVTVPKVTISGDWGEITMPSTSWHRTDIMKNYEEEKYSKV